ncbi:MAG: four helix bundle protein [Flavobacteriales bacterium]
MENKNYSSENLIVWQKAHSLVLNIYKITKQFPKDEIYGLTSQIRRASVSISANIAEGFGRRGAKDKLRFYNIPKASLNEVKYFLILSKDLYYYDTSNLLKDLVEVEKLLFGYMKSISDNPL